MLRALATWSGAIAGLLLIVAGGLIPAAFPFADQGTLAMRPLGVTLQVPALLLTALVGGHRAGLLAAAAYLSIGLFQLPVFHGGGGTSYLLDPGFGFLAGFPPAAWITGKLSRQNGMNDPLALAGAAAIGLLVLQFCGMANLLLGALVGRWGANGIPMLSGYAMAVFPQLLLCCAAGVLAWPLRHLLLIES
jgi:biotin transport system substrate-specific component